MSLIVKNNQSAVEIVSQHAETIKQVLHDIAHGSTVKAALKKHDVARQTWQRWCELEEVPDLLAMYKKARELQIESMGDDQIEIADDVTGDFDESGVMLNREHIMRSKLRIDARQLYIARYDCTKERSQKSQNSDSGKAAVEYSNDDLLALVQSK